LCTPFLGSDDNATWCDDDFGVTCSLVGSHQGPIGALVSFEFQFCDALSFCFHEPANKSRQNKRRCTYTSVVDLVLLIAVELVINVKI
jgi:hypothetical protein